MQVSCTAIDIIAVATVYGYCNLEHYCWWYFQRFQICARYNDDARIVPREPYNPVGCPMKLSHGATFAMGNPTGRPTGKPE